MLDPWKVRPTTGHNSATVTDAGELLAPAELAYAALGPLGEQREARSD